MVGPVGDQEIGRQMNATNRNYQILDTFSFNFSTADSWIRSRIVSGREGGGGSLRGSGLNQTNIWNFLFILILSGPTCHSFLYICYNFTFDDYKYCCVEVHDQLVPCEIIVISLKYFLCFMLFFHVVATKTYMHKDNS
jgi:hypothetical protein